MSKRKMYNIFGKRQSHRATKDRTTDPQKDRIIDRQRDRKTDPQAACLRPMGSKHTTKTD